MKRFRFLGMLAILGLLLGSCASVAHIEKDDTVNFSNYKTFAWIQTQDSTNEHKKNVSDLTERNIRNAVNAELEKAGWREAKNKPDVLLSYDVLVEKSVKQENNPLYSRPFSRVFFNPYTRRYATVFYPSQFMGYDNDEYEIREGTVTISMIDAKTDKTIWQGWTTDEVNSKNLTSREIQSSIKSIFRKFDVAKN